MATEFSQQVREFPRQVLISRGKVTETLQILRGSLLIGKTSEAQLRTSAQNLPNDGSVINVFERSGERGLKSSRFAKLQRELLHGSNRRIVNVSHHRFGQPTKGQLHVTKLSLRDMRCAAQ